jgi:hypothetical protein
VLYRPEAGKIDHISYNTGPFLSIFGTPQHRI